MQLELANACLVRPRDRLLEQRPADPATPGRRGDHQAEVGDVAARRVRVARDRQPSDDPVVVLGDEHGRVGMAAHGAEVAALVADRAPAAVGDQPPLGLGADRLGERDEGGGVARLGEPNGRRSHSTTIPCPPRRGSPAAASEPSAATVTADTPPK